MKYPRRRPLKAEIREVASEKAYAPLELSNFIQLGIFLTQFGIREFSIYKHWRGLQPDLALGGPIRVCHSW